MPDETELRSAADRPASAPASGGRPLGFNVIGYVSANAGLGVSARQITRLLIDKGYPVAVLDLDPGYGRGRYDPEFEDRAVKSPNALPYCINLVVLAIPSLPSFFLQPPSVLGGDASARPGSDYWLKDGCLNVALVWWELPVLRDSWKLALEAFDVVVAASPFIRATLETQLSHVFTLYARHPFALPERARSSRSQFGIPDGVVAFVTSFEPMSDPERKNPFAALEAFDRAFPDDARANLIVKLNNAGAAPQELVPLVTQLRERCAGDPRIRIIEETFSYLDVLGLYASCDVFVSLHRSEGLGFGLLEAMMLGRPVIATAWSGNMAFMDHSNSCLVGYELIPVDANLSVYSRELLGGNAMWADPDIDQAAAWMRTLVDDDALRLDIGNRAAAAMAEWQREARKGKFIEEIRAIWQNGFFLPGRSTEEKLSGIQRLRESLARPKRPPPTVWNQIGDRVRDAANKHLLWRFR